jgi:hypothetical protein
MTATDAPSLKAENLNFREPGGSLILSEPGPIDAQEFIANPGSSERLLTIGARKEGRLTNSTRKGGTLPHEIDSRILDAVPPGHIIYGRSLARRLKLPYKMVYYHTKNCLKGRLLLTLPSCRNRTTRIERLQKEMGGFKK